METFQENRWKPIYWPIMGQKRPINLAHRGQFSLTFESTHNLPANQVSWSHIKNFLRKWPKTYKIPILLLLFVIKAPLKKLEAKKSKFYFHNFWAIFVHIQAKYRKDWLKTEAAYLIWKKVDGRTDRRMDEGQLGINNLRWLCQQRSLKMQQFLLPFLCY